MHRDRPLQNSMFLQDTNGNRRNSIQFPSPNFNTLSKNSQLNYGHNITDGQYNITSMINQTGNSSSRKFYHQEQKDSSNNRNLQQKISQLNDKIEQMGRVVDRHDFQLGSMNFQNKKQDIYRQIIHEIKQNLPVITGNNDVYEHIFNLKLDIKGLKEQLMKFSNKINIDSVETPKTSENTQKKSLKDQETIPNKDQIFLQIKNQILRPRDEFFKNLIGNIQTEMGLLKKNLQNYTTDLKVSPISSSSCIILKYQQLFKSRNKNDTDIIINQQTYYVDNQGHLLDCHSRYIVDQKGKKVRLQDKHITMLRNQKIIQ